MFCKNCGNEIKEGEKICSKCGMSIENVQPNGGNKSRKIKDLNYYHKRLINDNKILLGVTIFFIIAIIGMSIAFANRMESYNDIAGFVLFKSLLFLIFEIIIIANRKQPNKSIVILAIIAGSIMIITTLFGSSVFDMIYFILAIIYLIHSSIYLSKFKKLSKDIELSDINTKEKTKLKYLTLLFIPLLIIIGILCYTLITSCVHSVVFLILYVLIIVANIIFCIYINKKYKKSVLVYIMLVISFIALFFGLIGIGDDVNFCLRIEYPEQKENIKKKNSPEYPFCKDMEKVNGYAIDEDGMKKLSEELTSKYKSYCSNKNTNLCNKLKSTIDEINTPIQYEDCDKITDMKKNLECYNHNTDSFDKKEEKVEEMIYHIQNKCDSKYGDVDDE